MNVTDNIVNIPAAAGPMWSYYAHPAARGDYPPVIMFFDAPGMREELQGMARRIAEQGYFCLLPDLYYRTGKMRFRLSHRDEEMSAVIRAVRQNVGHQQVIPDTQAMLAWLDGHGRARNGAAGLIGYCQGGRFVISAAGTFPERIRAGATLYGTDMVTDASDSPHLLAGKIKGELYLGFAEHDHRVPENVVPTLSARLNRNKHVTYRTEFHPNTEHGFCFPERAVYNEKAAELAWNRVFALFGRQLSS